MKIRYTQNMKRNICQLTLILILYIDATAVPVRIVMSRQRRGLPGGAGEGGMCDGFAGTPCGIGLTCLRLGLTSGVCVREEILSNPSL